VIACANASPRADYVGLATRLEQIAGRFILSVNDVPKTREIFRRFAIESR
jgi:DNA adenine methylase